ncbi:uncharacterized protein LOC116209946 [Punica granatum]|uniref:Synergin gamma C-terminal domain-containing protein n=2 Tax=Punica granatum TaxID=22663 RepID=A0A218XKR6_PUNGR|nr:uncharacterized protein LOC116209946 [Punica granatum]OWM85370.1 hypothetical protein CDL15_Pgr018994 [Punica granatum]PKI74075.1 hypothetical protein CRG98_005553 [Punica granatum]
MADIAEEEDDEGFGEFKFVPTTAAVSPNPAAASNGLADDYWSDFLSFNGSPRVESNPKPPPTQNSVEPFDFFGDRATAQRSAEATSTGTVPEKPKWVKPSGAIPLSLFGEEEEKEEEEEAGSGAVGASLNSATGLSNDSNGDPAKGAPNLGSAVGLNGFIVTLYNQNQHSGAPANESGLNLTSNGGILQELDAGIGSQAELNPKPILNGVDFNMSNGNGEKDEEDEWEFRAADAETRVKGENLNGDQRKGESGSDLNFNNFFPSWNGFSSDVNGFTSKPNGVELGTNGFNLTGNEKQENADDDFGWEFKGAEMENNNKEGNLKVEGSTRELFEEVELSFEFGNVVPEPTGVIVATDKNSQFFGLDFAYDLNPKPESQLNILSDSNLISNGKDVKNDSESNPTFRSFVSDEDAWEFKEATSEINPRSQGEPVVVNNATKVTSVSATNSVLQSGSNGEEDPKVVNGFFSNPINANVESNDDFWGFKDASSDSNLKLERNEESHVNGKEAFPLATVGDGKLENDGSLIYPDLTTRKSPNDSNMRRQPSNLSINDLIANLYNQATPIASVPDVQVSVEIGFVTSKAKLEEEPENEIDDFDDSWDFKAAETEKKDETSFNLVQQLSGTGLDSNQSGQVSSLLHSDGILDGSSWGFKDASSRLRYEDEGSVPSLVDPCQKFSAGLEIDDLLDFYSKLKDELCFTALSHLHRMKEAQNGLAGLPSDDSTLKDENREIQELYNALNPDDKISEVTSIDLPPRVPHLKGFLPVLDEKLQALEAEYQLSRKLSSADEDPQSLIELLRHVSLMLRILRWGTVEQQYCYVTAWSKLISLCSQELKHGALLWKQALEKDVQGHLLSKSDGKKYIIALGEIYRAVGVLGASIKLYKPWLLPSSADFSATSVLLNECSLLWSSSGFEEALRSMSDPLEFTYEGSVATLLDSIKVIHGLDEYAFQTYNFAGEEQLCRISLLSTELVGDMKMIEWNGEEYFLKLANLWANLASCNPPDLPRMEIS